MTTSSLDERDLRTEPFRPSGLRGLAKKLTQPLRRSSNSRLIRRFNRLFYHGVDGIPTFLNTSWLGVPTLKCPMDVWIYQEIIYRTKPEVILETGINEGGSSLMLGCLLDMVGMGSVVSVDISLEKVHAKARAHPRVTMLEGSSTSPEIIERMTDFARGKRTMVILDSDHSKSHVLQELALYGPLVSQGCYLIVEDTNVNGHPVYREHGPGPYEALDEWLPATDGWKIDHSQERLMVTFNPRGYLLRESRRALV